MWPTRMILTVVTCYFALLVQLNTKLNVFSEHNLTQTAACCSNYRTQMFYRTHVVFSEHRVSHTATYCAVSHAKSSFVPPNTFSEHRLPWRADARWQSFPEQVLWLRGPCWRLDQFQRRRSGPTGISEFGNTSILLSENNFKKISWCNLHHEMQLKLTGIQNSPHFWHSQPHSTLITLMSPFQSTFLFSTPTSPVSLVSIFHSINIHHSQRCYHIEFIIARCMVWYQEGW